MSISFQKDNKPSRPSKSGLLVFHFRKLLIASYLRDFSFYGNFKKELQSRENLVMGRLDNKGTYFLFGANGFDEQVIVNNI